LRRVQHDGAGRRKSLRWIKVQRIRQRRVILLETIVALLWLMRCRQLAVRSSYLLPAPMRLPLDASRWRPSVWP
jgi:hypothetical protein